MNIELMEANEQRVKIFKALADPTRIEIVRTLFLAKKELACGEVGGICAVSKSNASYHFRTLREAGLIKVRKHAQTKYTTLDEATLRKYLPGFLETLL
ncbi:ArsR/SmtB family transcription factor [Brevibacillus fulvus]|uniref:DNA-binding transcriptional ArsR family regulator n=1 Tax=Brevibacillus fulvus TaxID=1125967 RepID=A0A938Y1R1_9BACL|nr:metalloregulator ArsR/SmtB family transcription factor [Brevibacillus fulvus]MBM7590007.1 DNA-binding transcriptional ArsR family regulator [Brevibacillus fulvus]